LLSNDIMVVGSVHKDMEGIPETMVSMDRRAENSYEILCMHEDDDKEEKNKPLLHSYFYKDKTRKWQDNNSLFLTTYPVCLGTVKNDVAKKPAVFVLHQYAKKLRRDMDRKRGRSSTCTGNDRWVMSAFSYMLDIALANAETIWRFDSNNVRHKSESAHQQLVLFGAQLVHELINPGSAGENVKNNCPVINDSCEKILLRDGFKLHMEKNSDNRKCYVCKSSKSNVKNSKMKCEKEKNPEANIRKTPVNQCQFCSEAICVNHSIMSCLSCD